jgi:hypothetical protein
MDYHSHTAGDVGAAPEGHHHSAYDVGAAEDGHRHYPHDVGASPEGHEHQLHQVAGAASEQELLQLEHRVEQLAAALEAEKAANAALRSGAVTIPALVQVLRAQSILAESWESDLPISYALANLADAIEREART